MTRFLGNGQRPIGTIVIMAHTSSVYATIGRRFSGPFVSAQSRSNVATALCRRVATPRPASAGDGAAGRARRLQYTANADL
jgi:hypothetical protein